MTPFGIEPATFRFVAQQLNHCATAVPLNYIYIILSYIILYYIILYYIILYYIILYYIILYYIILYYMHHIR